MTSIRKNLLKFWWWFFIHFKYEIIFYSNFVHFLKPKTFSNINVQIPCASTGQLQRMNKNLFGNNYFECNFWFYSFSAIFFLLRSFSSQNRFVRFGYYLQSFSIMTYQIIRNNTITSLCWKTSSFHGIVSKMTFCVCVCVHFPFCCILFMMIVIIHKQKTPTEWRIQQQKGQEHWQCGYPKWLSFAVVLLSNSFCTLILFMNICSIWSTTEIWTYWWERLGKAKTHAHLYTLTSNDKHQINGTSDFYSHFFETSRVQVQICMR